MAYLKIPSNMDQNHSGQVDMLVLGDSTPGLVGYSLRSGFPSTMRVNFRRRLGGRALEQG